MAVSSIAQFTASAAGGALTRTFLVDPYTYNGFPKVLLVIDAVTNEDPAYTADVTEHPVEAGKEVTDHIQIKNPTLSIKGTISNSPLDLSVTIGNTLAGAVELATSSQFRENLLNTAAPQALGIAGGALQGGAAGALGQAKTGSVDALSRSLLISAFEQKRRLDVVTRRQRYTSMVIQSLKFPRDASTGFQLMFEIELKKIRIVKRSVTTIQNLAESKITSAASKTNIGGQSTAAISSKASSQMSSVTDSLKGMFSKSGFRSFVNIFRGGT